MSRVSTLSIVAQLDLSTARADYEKFKAELAAQPVRVTTAPTERTVSTFGGQSITTTAAPIPTGAPPPPTTSVTPQVTVSAQAVANMQRADSLAALRADFGQQFATAQANIDALRAAGATGGAGGGGVRARGGGGLVPFGRGFGTLGRVFTAGFAVSELARAGESFFEYGEQMELAAGDPLRELQARQAYYRDLASIPLVGRAADFATRGLLRATGQPSLTAQIEAEQRYRADLEAQTERRAAGRQAERQTTDLLREARTSGMANRNAQAIQQTRDAEERFREENTERNERMIDRITDLRREGRNVEAERAEQELAQFKFTLPARESAFGELQATRRGVINREYTRETLMRGRETRAQTLAETGRYLQAALLQVDVETGADVDEQGNLIGFEGLRLNQKNLTREQREDLDSRRHQRDVLRDTARRNEQQRIREAESGERAAVSRLFHDPLGAQLEDIAGAREAALFRIDDPEERRRIQRRFDLQAELATQHYGERRQDISTALEAQRQSIQSALRREPGEVGEAARIQAAGAVDTRGLLRGGMFEQAAQAYQNTLARLQLVRQDYFDSIQAVQASQLTVGFSQRGAEDPNSVVAAIEKQTEALKQAYRDALLEAIAN